MKKRFLFFFLLLGIAGILTNCTSQEQGNKATEAQGSIFHLMVFEEAEAPPEFQTMVKDGKLEHGEYWLDQNGENYLGIISSHRDTSIQLKAVHLVEDHQGEFRVLQQITDFIGPCHGEAILSMIPGSLTITDMDSNRLAEITFIYQRGCLTGDSPLKTRLCMLENGSEYTIRGNLFFKKNGEIRDEERETDPEFSKLPVVLSAYADAQWSRFTDTTIYSLQ